MENKNIYWRQSVDALDCGSGVKYRNKSGRMKLWRHNSLGNIVSYTKKNSIVYESTPTTYENMTYNTSNEISNSEGISKKNKGQQNNAIVSIVLVEAKGLPEPPEDGSNHNLYCKIRLGLETLKSKSVPNTRQPEWRERFQILRQNDNLLRISLWDKGKLKNFMGSCVLDLSPLERDRTHEIWQELDDGYGSVHLSVTIFTTRKLATTHDEHAQTSDFRDNDIFNFTDNWNLVGKLQVKVVMAKGLYANPDAYCVIELDNERVQTHSAQGPTEPVWNRSYIFNVYDVTSTLDLKVYDSSLVSTIRNEPSGKISIPLLRIRNGETRWYALKDKYKRNSAKGNCPRILLEMSLIWNPIKGSLRLFQPKEVKHIKESPKFDIALVYKNLEFVRDNFEFLQGMNENYKRLFEWENQEFSAIALFIWLLFWYYFELWMAPLMLLTPFIYFWVFNKNQQEKSFTKGYNIVDVAEQNEYGGLQNEKSFTGKIQNLPDITSTITKGTEYMASVAERLYNLASFKMPFLSYLTMFLLIVISLVFYLIPYNYLLMSLGIYKFTRKYMNPERVSNNDLLDFLSRIPDNELLKDWKELSVPEPIHPKRITYGSAL